MPPPFLKPRKFSEVPIGTEADFLLGFKDDAPVRIAPAGIPPIDETLLGMTALAALAGNTVSTLDFGNITAGFKLLKVSGGDSMVTIGSGFGVGSIFPHEMVIRSIGGNLNAGAIQSLSSDGWSSWTFRSSDDFECGSIGYGNPLTVATAGFRGAYYFESTRLPVQGGATEDCGPIIFSQFTTYGGNVAMAHHHRMRLTATGEIEFLAYDDAAGGTLGPLKRLAQFKKDEPVLTLGNSTGSFGYGEIRGADANWSMVLREGGDGANANSLYCYGGNLANGGGWKIYSGGVKGSQTLGLQVANDLLLIGRGIVVTPQVLTGVGALAAVNLTTATTTITTTGAATSTMGVGTDGQRKRLSMIADGGDCVVTVTNLQGGTTLTFNDVGDNIELEYNGAKWQVSSNNGVVIG